MGHSTDEGWWNMSDTCWLQVELRGNIDSVFTLVRVAHAILNENLTDEIDAGEPTVGHILKHIANCISWGSSPDFTEQEANYGRCDRFEEAMQRLGVAYAVQHAAGGDYGPMVYSWMPGRGRVEASCFHDGGPALEIHELRRGLKNGTLEGMVQALEQARGDDLPKFTVTGTAERMIAKLQAVTALKVA